MSIPRRSLLFLISLWIGLVSVAMAEGNLLLKPHTPQFSLAGSLQHWIDSSGEASLEEAMGQKFTPLREFLNQGFSAQVHWLTWTVERSPEAAQEWILELGPVFIDTIQIYQVVAGKMVGKTLLGDHVPLAERPLQTRLFAMPVYFEVNQPVTFYARIQTTSTTSLAGGLKTPAAFIAGESYASTLLGIYFGVLLVIVILYTIVGLWLANGDMLSYTLYVFSLLGLNLVNQGYYALLFAPADGWHMDLVTGLVGMLTIATGANLWDRMLDNKTYFPRMHKIYMALALLAILVLPWVTTPYYTRLAPLAQAGGALVGYVSTVLVMIRWYRSGLTMELAIFFLAFLASTIGSFQLVFMNLGYFKRTFFNEYSFLLAGLVHVLLLSIAFGQRVRKIQQDKVLAETTASTTLQRMQEQRRFVGMLSHEFRTPLTAIDKAAQMIQLTVGQLEEGAVQRLMKIRNNARQLYGYIDIFLTSEALDHGSLVLDPQPCALGELVERVVREADNPSRLVVEGGNGYPLVAVDATLFPIALANLINNALKYSPPESVVRVVLEVVDRGLRLHVVDQGKGMDQEELEQIGKQYFRGKTAKGIKGIGMGISLTQRIIGEHGAKLIFTSEVGKGTTATILFMI